MPPAATHDHHQPAAAHCERRGHVNMPPALPSAGPVRPPSRPRSDAFPAPRRRTSRRHRRAGLAAVLVLAALALILAPSTASAQVAQQPPACISLPSTICKYPPPISPAARASPSTAASARATSGASTPSLTADDPPTVCVPSSSNATASTVDALVISTISSLRSVISAQAPPGINPDAVLPRLRFVTSLACLQAAYSLSHVGDPDTATGSVCAPAPAADARARLCAAFTASAFETVASLAPNADAWHRAPAWDGTAFAPALDGVCTSPLDLTAAFRGSGDAGRDGWTAPKVLDAVVPTVLVKAAGLVVESESRACGAVAAEGDVATDRARLCAHACASETCAATATATAAVAWRWIACGIAGAALLMLIVSWRVWAHRRGKSAAPTVNNGVDGTYFGCWYLVNAVRRAWRPKWWGFWRARVAEDRLRAHREAALAAATARAAPPPQIAPMNAAPVPVFPPSTSSSSGSSRAARLHRRATTSDAAKSTASPPVQPWTMLTNLGSPSVAQFAYVAVLPDEIDLHVGDLVLVHEAFADDWALASHLGTGHVGVVPLPCLRPWTDMRVCRVLLPTNLADTSRMWTNITSAPADAQPTATVAGAGCPPPTLATPMPGLAPPPAVVPRTPIRSASANVVFPPTPTSPRPPPFATSSLAGSSVSSLRGIGASAPVIPRRRAADSLTYDARQFPPFGGVVRGSESAARGEI
ncbi:hypothetical protein AMAG_16214 [Allomyces macrogynus ATCC 38327]|uniref:SH3 domain-containing protein n=1 Tax=Allomyces macrogynus (strain ATCC 38327) TaxID=578462 RepID=A0A0L0TA20_ALLM3|nr:hypothetical protein AMAG_16214 [Allomyces macrogynus ATCC 38327]|eukprot:KNE71658.1 hypothetical protein AMAG_16214 [Allomyces macrogynus ATCC 38327]